MNYVNHDKVYKSLAAKKYSSATYYQATVWV